MTMRLATITFPVLLSLLADPSVAVAQGQSSEQGEKTKGNQGAGQGGDPGKVQGSGTEEEKILLGPQHGEGDDPEKGITDGIDIAAVYESSFNVQLMQDPVRIGPGETGTLLLYVTPNRGTSIDAGGSVKMNRKQGSLNFGAPAFDPPKNGKARHSDSYFIRIPVTVAPGTKYGSHQISAALRLRGHFSPSRHFDNPEVNKRVIDANKNAGSRTVTGRIVVGRPIPKPKRRPMAKAAKKATPKSAGDAAVDFVSADLGLKARAVFAPRVVVRGASSSLRIELDVPEAVTRFSVKSLRVDGDLDGLDLERFNAGKVAKERTRVELGLDVQESARLGVRSLEAICEAQLAANGGELRTTLMRLPLSIEVVETELATAQDRGRQNDDAEPELGVEDSSGGPPLPWIAAGAGLVLIVLLMLARRGR